MSKPLAIDICCGLGGWATGLLAEGYDVVGFDIEQHIYGEHRYPAQLVLQDVRTIHGRQFKDAALLVASPPCTEFSWMAMPWSRARQVARALRGEAEFPDGYKGSRTTADLTALFDACFRIQCEASAAAGRKIPLVIENVRGAQPWVGRANWQQGSFCLWGDVPALMPIVVRAVKVGGLDWKPPDDPRHRPGQAFNPAAQGAAVREGTKMAGFRFDGSGKSFQTASVNASKNADGSWFNIAHNTTSGKGQNPDGRKRRDKDGYERDHPNAFGWNAPRTTSRGKARKMASAMIAKIPLDLARHIGRSWFPRSHDSDIEVRPDGGELVSPAFKQ